jgi:hypothetical protein
MEFVNPDRNSDKVLDQNQSKGFSNEVNPYYSIPIKIKEIIPETSNITTFILDGMPIAAPFSIFGTVAQNQGLHENLYQVWCTYTR